MTDPVILRPMVPDSDEGYLYSTWLRDLRDADPSGLPDDLWFPAHRAHIDRVLRDRSMAVIIAAAADKPTEILGYVVAQPATLLEWVFVRKPLRGKGLAKRLLVAANINKTTPSRWTTPLARKRLVTPWQSRAVRRQAKQRTTESGSDDSEFSRPGERR